MKRKDIKKILKDEAERFTPDPIDKIKTAARAENLLPYGTETNTEEYRQGDTAVIGKSKRKAVWLLTAFASLIVCLVLILTFTLSTVKDRPFSPVRTNLSVEDVYGMGAVSSVRLLESNVSASAVKAFSAVSAAADTRSAFASGDASEEEVKEQAKRFNQYFTALDSFLGDDIVSTVTEANTDGAYAFETKMTVNGKNFDGETVTYTMYYTETLRDAEDDDDDDDDGEEVEREYSLVGVMVIDGAVYRLEGERSEETERDESETELKIRAYADIEDKTSYIEMEQEHSAEDGETETEYVYSIYVNGKLTEQTAVEFERENEDGKIETEYELEFRSGGSKGRYVVERGAEDGAEIKVEYDIDGKTGVFRIREIKDENGGKKYEYIFSDNDVMIF